MSALLCGLGCEGVKECVVGRQNPCRGLAGRSELGGSEFFVHGIPREESVR